MRTVCDSTQMQSQPDELGEGKADDCGQCSGQGSGLAVVIRSASSIFRLINYSLPRI